eukprot:1618461-Alexandrium_andersonii.AAC.1
MSSRPRAYLTRCRSQHPVCRNNRLSARLTGRAAGGGHGQWAGSPLPLARRSGSLVALAARPFSL